MLINAKFTGTNSLGYKNGMKYNLIVSDIGGVSVQRSDKTGLCEYTSLSSFLKNWNEISVLKS